MTYGAFGLVEVLGRGECGSGTGSDVKNCRSFL